MMTMPDPTMTHYYFVQFAENLFVGCLVSAFFLICGLRLLDRKDLSFKSPIRFKKVVGLTFLLFGIAGFIRELLTIKISSR